MVKSVFDHVHILIFSQIGKQDQLISEKKKKFKKKFQLFLLYIMSCDLLLVAITASKYKTINKH